MQIAMAAPYLTLLASLFEQAANPPMKSKGRVGVLVDKGAIEGPIYILPQHQGVLCDRIAYGGCASQIADYFCVAVEFGDDVGDIAQSRL
jgi:hypothetical protein